VGGDGAQWAFASRAIRGAKMSAWFNLKMLGSAALALGISAVSLCPETASANIFLFFNGTCNTSGCPDTTSTATGVLTLTNA
jgi:hypothetical protein